MAEIDTSAEAVARMLDGVTPGPWVEFISDDGGQWTGWPLSIDCTSIVDKTIVRPGGQWPYKWDAKTSCDEACANARFIAWSRDAVPALAAERDRLSARIRALEAQLAAQSPAEVWRRAIEAAADIVKNTPEWKFGNLWHRRDIENNVRALPSPDDLSVPSGDKS